MKKIPGTKHYAIILEIGTYVPGDLRSQTNPGHGYPAETVYSLNYLPYTNKEEWEEKIKELTFAKERFTAIEAIPMDIIPDFKIMRSDIDEQ
jgi:hypothetical protein